MLPFLKKKIRVLLLDDDPSMQRLVSTILKRAGCRVDVFLTGRDALGAISTQDYDVLLLDLMMPHEGGMTVIRHLREKKPEMLRRAVVLTASSESVIDSVSDGVAAIVLKPFKAEQLIDTVRSVSAAA
jgi:DNA-binding response OmpR family regulator